MTQFFASEYISLNYYSILYFLGGITFKLESDTNSHINCRGLYSSFGTKAEAIEACEKDNLCEGFYGKMASPLDPFDTCEHDVTTFYLCKRMIYRSSEHPENECHWRKQFGGKNYCNFNITSTSIIHDPYIYALIFSRYI